MTSFLLTVTVESDMPRGEVQARTSLRNLQGIARLQRICDRFGVTPTYLLTYPAATQPAGQVFEPLVSDGRAEVGAYLQPWVTPPFDVNEDRLTIRPPNQLPASLVRSKLERLTEAIERRYGVRPRAHRAARFGLNGATLQALEALGYIIDTSAAPFLDNRRRGGIDWRQAPEAPYFPDRQDPVRRGSSPVLEVPMSLAWDRALPDCLARWIVERSPTSPIRAAFENRYLPVARLSWLDPIRSNFADLRQLSDLLINRGLPALTMRLRSHQLWPGESRSCPTAGHVDRLLETLEAYLRYVIDEMRVTPHTLSGFTQSYLSDS